MLVRFNTLAATHGRLRMVVRGMLRGVGSVRRVSTESFVAVLLLAVCTVLPRLVDVLLLKIFDLSVLIVVPTLQTLALELAGLVANGLSMMTHLRSRLLFSVLRLLVVALLERPVNASCSHDSTVALQTIPQQVIRTLMRRVDILVHLGRIAWIELGLRLLGAIDIHVLLSALLAALHLLEGHRLLRRLDELRIISNVRFTVVRQL